MIRGNRLTGTQFADIPPLVKAAVAFPALGGREPGRIAVAVFAESEETVPRVGRPVEMVKGEGDPFPDTFGIAAFLVPVPVAGVAVPPFTGRGAPARDARSLARVTSTGETVA